MARASGTSVENNFTKGFLTEFSGFNFPENACAETLNCVFDQTGSVSRRLGLGLEEVESPPTIAYNSTSIFTSFVWKSAGYRSENSFLVHQVDNLLYFYRIVGDKIADNKTSFTFDLNSVRTDGLTSAQPGLYLCQFANGSGRLFVANPNTEPFYLKYDTDTETISATTISVKIRDFKVLPDGYAIISNMPFSLASSNQAYVYNIKNQGWTDAILSGWNSQGNSQYPNKGQVWWYFRDAAQSAIVPYFLDFRPGARYKFQDLGASLAPRGTYILNAFNQDRNAVSGLVGLPTLSSRTKRPGCSAFINGRLFLSGVEADGYNGVVYFSNILKDVDDDIRFYQNGDPTSEVNPQLLPNDGGTFIIPEAGRIIRMIPVKSTLVIFATNGIWVVQGNEGVGFTATDFTIEKISDEPCIENQSYVVVSTFPIWWTNEGIHTLQSSNIGAINSQSLTEKTIQTFYDEIPLASKKYVKSGYNSLTKEIFWLYSSNSTSPRIYNRVLVLNLNTEGFYLHSLPDNYSIVDIVSPPVAESTVETVNVTNNAGTTVVNSTSAVVTVEKFGDFNSDSLGNVKFVIKYLTNKIGFAKFQNTDLKDWADLTSPGVNYNSYFITGPRVRGDGQRKFQENYVTVFSRYKVNGSCWMYSIWDYGNNTNSNRWGTPQQAIILNANYNYYSRRLKIRGNGRAVQFRFESEGNKPFDILGWSAFETVNERV